MNSKNNTSGGRGSTSQNPHTPSRASNRKTHQNSRARTPAQSKSQGGGQPSVPMSGVPFGYVPAFLPGSASLVEQLDRRIMVVLRDGRHLVGILRSFDQFSNMVLDETSERRVLHLKKSKNDEGDEVEVTCYYTDILLGLYLVRGDSTVLLGEVDGDQEEGEKDEAVVTAGYNSSVSAEGLTGSGLLMGSSVKKEQTKKHMKKVSLEQFEAMKLKQEEEGDDAVNQLTWEFDLDLVV